MSTTLFAVVLPGGINHSNVTTDTLPRHEHFKIGKIGLGARTGMFQLVT